MGHRTRHQLPENCLGVSHDGRQLDVADDGSLDLDPAAAAALAPHGVAATVASAEPAPDDGKPPRRGRADARAR